jgi:hypothetical protein
MIHKGEKPFTCAFEGCNKSFIEKGNMKIHFQTHFKTKGRKSSLKSIDERLTTISYTPHNELEITNPINFAYHATEEDIVNSKQMKEMNANNFVFISIAGSNNNLRTKLFLPSISQDNQTFFPDLFDYGRGI